MRKSNDLLKVQNIFIKRKEVELRSIIDNLNKKNASGYEDTENHIKEMRITIEKLNNEQIKLGNERHNQEQHIQNLLRI